MPVLNLGISYELIYERQMYIKFISHYVYDGGCSHLNTLSLVSLTASKYAHFYCYW